MPKQDFVLFNKKMRGIKPTRKELLAEAQKIFDDFLGKKVWTKKRKCGLFTEEFIQKTTGKKPSIKKIAEETSLFEKNMRKGIAGLG